MELRLKLRKPWGWSVGLNIGNVSCTVANRKSLLLSQVPNGDYSI